MSGIDYLIDERGKKKAVLIDLKKHGLLWEDIYDTLICESRKSEPFESHEFVKKRLRARRARA